MQCHLFSRHSCVGAFPIKVIAEIAGVACCAAALHGIFAPSESDAALVEGSVRTLTTRVAPVRSNRHRPSI